MVKATRVRSDGAGTGAGKTKLAYASGACLTKASALSIFFLAFTVRLLHLLQIRRSPFFDLPMGDSQVYDAWAVEIARGDWMGHEVFYQAPLYPYFLGAIFTVAGHDLLVVRLVQIVLGSIACVFIAHATSRIVSRRAGIVAGVLLALYPPAIFFDALLQKTVLDAFLMSLSIWILTGIMIGATQWPSWLALGAALGALSLTRENALALVAVVAVWAVVSSPARVRSNRNASRLPPLAAFLFGTALVLLPVAARNFAVGGGFYLTTSQFGTNLYLGNNPRTDGTAGSLVGGRGSAEYERQDAIDLAERATGRRLTPGEVSSYWIGRVAEYIRSQPGDWLALMARKFTLLWNRSEAFDTESQESYAEWSTPLTLLGGIGHFGLLVPLAAIGVWITWPDRSRLLILYLLAATYAASVILFFIYARYRFPLVPFLIIFAASAFDQGHRFCANATRRQLATLTAVVLAIAVFTNWPLLSSATMRAVTEHNLGAALQSDGRLDQAIERYRRAVAIKPDYAPAYSNLGTVLAAKGDLAGAVTAYERALAADPGVPDARYNLGNALLRNGDPRRAVDQFQRALAAAPDSVEVRTNLAIALAELGQLDDGVRFAREAVSLKPTSAITQRVLGQILSTLNRPEAETALREATRLAPSDADARYALARWLLERERFADAIPQLTALVEIAPRSADAHNDLGIALASSGRTSDAVQEFRLALELNPRFDAARRNLAAAMEAAGKR
jgi:tetratricopeptide (TPR) repeat protein